VAAVHGTLEEAVEAKVVAFNDGRRQRFFCCCTHLHTGHNNKSCACGCWPWGSIALKFISRLLLKSFKELPTRPATSITGADKSHHWWPIVAVLLHIRQPRAW
jgi:hypothetical protein